MALEGYIDELREFFKGREFTACFYCYKNITGVDFSIDHAIPLSRGGSNTKDNFRLCCKRCNLAKGDMTEEEFKKLLLVVMDFDDDGERVIKRLVASGNMFRKWRRRYR